MNPGPVILREMSRRSIPVVIGADAHQPERVADCFDEALQLLEQCGYHHVHFFLERRRQRIAITEFRSQLCLE